MIQSTDSIRDWLLEIDQKSLLRLNKITIQDCAQWQYRGGQLRHRTGRFFTVTGLSVDDVGTAKHAQQLAMIDQPEVGWLGFLIRRAPGGIEWLAQAKTEPGNINATQLAPSIQATRSNYQRSHGGRATAFLDLFRGARSFVSDSPHSEQGTRFLWKFNRNSVVILPHGQTLDLRELGHWMWCSSASIRDLLADDYRVNTDARSVIATAPWALLADGGLLFSAPTLAKSYEQIKGPRFLETLLGQISPRAHPRVPRWLPVALDKLNGWTMDDGVLRDPRGREMVSCFEVHVKGREVDSWCQPFLMQAEQSDHVLLMRLTEKGAEFFVRVYDEVGFGTRQEYGPSLHNSFKTPPRMQSWSYDKDGTELVRIRQSDEGGRFMEADACYRIVLVEGAPPRDQYPFGCWVGLSTLEKLVTRPGTTTNELRTLVSLILSRAFDAACARL